MRYKQFINANNIGLTLNIVGTLLVAYAFGELPFDEGYAFLRNPITGQTSYFRDAYFVHPAFFSIGIVLILLGFIFQLKKSK